MWDTVREYISALGPWVWVLIADIIGIIQDYLLDIPYLTNVPSSVWIILLFIFFFVANLNAYHKIRVERDDLQKLINNNEHLRSVVKRLAELRTQGVSIRNSGMAEHSAKEQEKWIEKVMAWESTVLDEIEKISLSRAEMFRTLDSVNIRAYASGIPQIRRKKLDILSDELVNLTELINKLDPAFNDDI